MYIDSLFTGLAKRHASGADHADRQPRSSAAIYSLVPTALVLLSLADDPVLKQAQSRRANRTMWLITAITGGTLLLVASVTWVILHIR